MQCVISIVLMDARLASCEPCSRVEPSKVSLDQERKREKIAELALAPCCVTRTTRASREGKGGLHKSHGCEGQDMRICGERCPAESKVRGAEKQSPLTIGLRAKFNIRPAMLVEPQTAKRVVD